MKKIVVLLLLVLTCAFAFAGGDSEVASEIKIGGIGPLTGDYANYGTSVKNGAELAASEIKEVNGIPLTVLFQDSKADNAEAVKAYGALIDSGMNISLGGVLSGETANIAAEATNDGIFVLTATASADRCILDNDKAFRVCFADSTQGSASAAYINEYDLADTVAVFYQSDVDYSTGLYNTFTEKAAEVGIEIVEVQSFTKDQNTDFSSQINAILSSDADLVFAPIYASDAATFLIQADAKGLDTTVFGCDGLDGLLTKLGDAEQEYAEGVMILTAFSADAESNGVPAFVSAYKENYGATPDQFAAAGYDAIYVIAELIKNAGVTAEDLADIEALGDTLTAAILELDHTGVTGKMTWTAEGNSDKLAQAMIIKKTADGSYKAVLN